MRKFLLYLFLVAAASLAFPQDRTNARSMVISPWGIVASSQVQASQAGAEILSHGGSAVDAAIATNAVLGLMEPDMNGIGGDLFAIYWEAKSGKLYGLNASGRAPLGLSYDQMRGELAKFKRTTIPPFGMLPISVPGCVDGWFELHKKFGKLPMKQVLQPAITYATEGFPVSELIAYYWDRSVPILKSQPGAFLQTFTINGRAPAKGEIFRNPPLAHTLQLLADQGRDVFYKGEIADQIDKFFAANGGFLRKTWLRACVAEVPSANW